MRARSLLAALVLLASAPAAPAGAAPPWGPGAKKAKPGAAKAGKQDQAEQLRRKRFEALVADGDAFLAAARQHGQPDPTSGQMYGAESYANEALRAYDQALALYDDAEVHYRAWVAAGYLGDTQEHWLRVLRHHDGLRAVSPQDPRDTTMIPETCTALAKLGAAGGPDADAYFARGVAEYEIWRRRIDDTDQRYAEMIGVYSTNAAELAMALGPDHLDHAIELYELGIERLSFESLGYYGAAVAHDRAGNWGKAEELMKMAIERDTAGQGQGGRGPNMMPRLSSRGVYFVPDGDIDYYYALGFQVQGYPQLALQHYKRFLTSLPKSPYADVARAHVAALEKELAK